MGPIRPSAQWQFVPFCLILAGVAGAQTTFMRLYNKGYEGRSVRELGVGYAVAGGTDAYANWHWNQLSPIASTSLHLFKTDVNGGLLWEKTYNRPGARTTAVWMEPTADGGYILAANGNSDRVWPPDSDDVLLIKTDGLGIVSWCKRFDTGQDEITHCVRPTADGGYVVSGFHDVAPISLFGTTYALLIKTDGLGNLLWCRKYPLAVRDLITHEPFTYVVRPLEDGGYAIVGTALGSIALGVYVIRTDANGAVLWAKVYEHDAGVLRYSTGLDIVEAPDGDLIIAGSMDKQQPLQTNYPYLLRLNSTGTLLHARFFETDPLLMFQSGFSSVVGTTDGGWFFTGMGGYGSFGDQAQLLKTDADLNPEWSRVYTTDGAGTMGSRSGRPTSDGGYVFTGKHQFAGTVLMKTNAQGLIPCKTPSTLIENVPSLLVQNRFPVPLAGINTSDVLLTTGSPLIDTGEPCPLQIVLPIELLAFTVEALPERRAGLHWSTATETNNDHFVVERGSDGVQFSEVAHLDGVGSSVHEVDYTFTDEDPLVGDLSYYRLRQVDSDGAESFSEAVAVRFGAEHLHLVSAIGDRAGGSITLVVGVPHAAELAFRVMDCTGRIVATGSRACDEGLISVVLDAQGLSAGIHAFTLSNGEERITGKVCY